MKLIFEDKDQKRELEIPLIENEETIVMNLKINDVVIVLHMYKDEETPTRDIKIPEIIHATGERIGNETILGWFKPLCGQGKEFQINLAHALQHDVRINCQKCMAILMRNGEHE
jgi:hypothetical protein